jgi:UDP-N-acetylmuramate--alanine ligase
MHPSFIIGGEVHAMGTGAVWDRGEWFVVEADESDGTFLSLPRRAALVTNVEPDHLEHWGGFEPLRRAFADFLAATEGPTVVCADDPVAAELAAATGAVTYGTAEGARYRIGDLERSGDGTTFVLHDGDRVLGRLALPIPGAHNARNAAGAVAMALELGAPFAAAAAAMGAFTGVARRFQRRGEAAGVTFIDSYDHLPSETQAALGAATDGRWDRIVCVFQPHRYSRTATLWPTFGDAFVGADVLVVTDVYASGEAPRPGVSGKLIVDAVLGSHPWQRVVYLPHRGDLVAFLERELRAGDLCLTLGAGDLTTLPDEVLAVLRARRGTGAGGAAGGDA